MSSITIKDQSLSPPSPSSSSSPTSPRPPLLLSQQQQQQQQLQTSTFPPSSPPSLFLTIWKKINFISWSSSKNNIISNASDITENSGETIAAAVSSSSTNTTTTTTTSCGDDDTKRGSNKNLSSKSNIQSTISKKIKTKKIRKSSVSDTYFSDENDSQLLQQQCFVSENNSKTKNYNKKIGFLSTNFDTDSEAAVSTTTTTTRTRGDIANNSNLTKKRKQTSSLKSKSLLSVTRATTVTDSRGVIGDSGSDDVQESDNNNDNSSNSTTKSNFSNSSRRRQSDDLATENFIANFIKEYKQLQRNQRKKNMIFYYGREFICILALILTTYATFQNVPPKISKISPPKPFFQRGSLVDDYPTGHLEIVQNRVQLSELSLVMFYAPWCAESQHARTAYEYAAKLFYREAHFAAINCWQPGGECRHQYAKIVEWPVVMAYLQNGLAVPYNGKWSRSGLTKFVRSLLNPLKRVSNTDDLLNLIMIHDVVIAAAIDINKEPLNYRAYYHTAVKWLEKDPFQSVCFVLITGESAKEFGITVLPVLRVYLWNGTMEYSGTERNTSSDASGADSAAGTSSAGGGIDNNNWTQPELQKWISSQIIQITRWLTPPGSKANTIAPYLKNGPVLMLFTPRTQHTESNDAYTMLRQISMEYNNCPDINFEWIKQMSRSYIADARQLNQQNYQEFIKKCAKLMLKNIDGSDTDDKFSDSINLTNKCGSQTSVSFGNIVNSSKSSLSSPSSSSSSSSSSSCPHNFNEIFEQEDQLSSWSTSSCFLSTAKYLNPTLSSSSIDTMETCAVISKKLLQNQKNNQNENSNSDSDANDNHNNFKKKQETFKISMLNSEYDNRGSENLLKISYRKKCESHFGPHPDDVGGISLFFDGASNPKNFDKITSLSCKLNRTLSFVAIDSILYHTFAERLGLDILNIENKSAAVILDHENESTYVLQEPLTTDNLINFVHKYSTRNITRHLNVVPSTQQSSQSEIINNKNNRKKSKSNIDNDDKNKIKTKRQIKIREINSKTFEENVLLSNKTVVVLFYSLQCALCSIISQTLLITSKILADLPQIDFVRIDGDRNDLPWQYTMEKFPSLIVFDAIRKSENRIYPINLKITVPNVLGFVLANLNRPTRLHGIVLTCKNIQKSFPFEDCLATLRKEIVDDISFSLHEWRKVPYRRGQIIRRLQILQRFYLHLFMKIDKNSCDHFNNLILTFVRDIGRVWTI